MGFMRRAAAGLVVTALAIMFLALAAAQLWQALSPDPAARAGRPRAEQVYTAPLVTLTGGTVTPVIQVFGAVQARRRLELRAGTAGRIVFLDPALHEGGSVSAGQVLIGIDPSAAQAEHDNQQAMTENAQAALDDARRRVGIARDDLDAAQAQAGLRAAAVARQARLAERGLGTKAEREAVELAASAAAQAVLTRRAALADAESAVTAAQNALRRSTIALAEAARVLDQTRISARFAGRVTNVTAVEGGLASVNEKLAEIIDPQSLEVALPLSVAQFSRLVAATGSLPDAALMVTLRNAGTDIVAQARLDRTAASVADGSAGRQVFAAITQGGAALRPGDFVSVAIPEPSLQQAAELPAGALGGDGTVLVADDQGRLSAVAVQVLRRQADTVIIAVPATLAGAQVVASRAPYLGAGIRIRPARDSRPEPAPEPTPRTAPGDAPAPTAPAQPDSGAARADG
ncbi:efflux RND transporter periplasmic adaptor subunit [Paracoccus jiaweipingae]|uniref:efflux RND transporter periplasmic adaptor subunit n=1 Tax=unclassified Paracoccus (in: a-proteobacteria) TaxID=2688777 RepID=UPI0037AB97C6